MALVTITKDAQNPHATQCIDYKAQGTLLECANKMLGEWEESPWICVLMRGENRFHPLREEWGEVELEENDKVCFPRKYRRADNDNNSDCCNSVSSGSFVSCSTITTRHFRFWRSSI